MNDQPSNSGVLDEARNPFGTNRLAWKEQRYGLTEHRMNQLLDILNLPVDEIMNAIPEHENRYIAFVAVRWGLAEIVDERLKKTSKLVNWINYDEYGELNN